MTTHREINELDTMPSRGCFEIVQGSCVNTASKSFAMDLVLRPRRGAMASNRKLQRIRHIN